MSYVSHDFYCIKCGQKSIPLPRKKRKLHGGLHRKKLYCPNCKLYINHAEVRNDEDKEEFMELFEQGFFLEEVEESLRESEKELLWV